MKRYALTVAFAAMGAIAAAQAQTPATGQQPSPTEPQATTAQAGTTKLFGCVYREQDVAGRSPNVAERAGVMEDYILADASMTNDTSATSATPSTPGATGTSGTHKMYKLEKIADEQLRAVVGKRVEVTGRIDAEAGDAKDRPAGTAGTTPGTTPAPDKSVGPDQIELPEFEVTSIREVSGTCPAKPAQHK